MNQRRKHVACSRCSSIFCCSEILGVILFGEVAVQKTCAACKQRGDQCNMAFQKRVPNLMHMTDSQVRSLGHTCSACQAVL